MNKIIFVAIIMLSAISTNYAQKEISKHFIIIGCDGMSPDGIRNANTPNMDEMMDNGSYTFAARAVLPTSSSPNWASMVMGAGPEQHGITSNDWERDDHLLKPAVKGKEGIFPTIFSTLKTQRKDFEIGAIYHWGGFGRLIEKSFIDFDKHEDSEELTTETTVKYIKDKKPNFLFVHLDHVDGAGHEYGHGTKLYYKSVEKADKLIGEIVKATKDAGIFESTTFLVTADHGGIGYGHGGETMEEIEIPFILSGNCIKSGHRIKHNVAVYDYAPTVAFALGVEQPYAWIGRPVKSSFVGNDDPKQLSNQKSMLPAPIIYPAKNLYNPAGGFFIDEYAEMKIETEIEDAEIRYTTDGSEPNLNSELYKAPVTIKKSCVVNAKIFKGDDEESYVTSAYFRIANSKSKNGLNYKYYETEKIKSLPLFEKMKETASGKTFQIRNTDLLLRKENVALKFYGFIKIDEPGEYRFYTNSDDGSKLYINEKQVVNNDGDHGTKERSGKIKLDEGFHKIEVEYFNGGGGSWLDVFYKGPKTAKQIIPPDVLFTEKN